MPDVANEWDRYSGVWHAVFAGLAALTAALIIVDHFDPVALGLLAAMGLWYVVAGRRALRRATAWAGPAYLAGAVPLTLGLFAASPVGALMLFVLYPHVWAMVRTRLAIGVTFGVVAGCTALAIAQSDLSRDTLLGWLIFAVVSLALALLLGLWIARIVAQSQRRAQLLAELAATRATLEQVSREAGALAERERLAREIHDTLAQGFTSVLILLEAALSAGPDDPQAAREMVERARDTARENLAEARALVAALTPPDLSQTSLPEALRRIVDRATVQSGPHAELAVCGVPRGLPTAHEVALLRIAQEALTNVGRHAGASKVAVVLDYGDGGVSLRVSDDGRGFDPAAAPAGGFGLEGMRSRAAGVGGVVTVDTAPGRGVSVCLKVPDSP
ncbi:MAG TPA: sensor histidine kinase [Candidatus Limnocylindrales bacterium]|nr:sensor histidine kinase [Candidatus Limnocylindrales bacterium]